MNKYGDFYDIDMFIEGARWSIVSLSQLLCMDCDYTKEQKSKIYDYIREVTFSNEDDFKKRKPMNWIIDE